MEVGGRVVTFFLLKKLFSQSLQVTYIYILVFRQSTTLHILCCARIEGMAGYQTAYRACDNGNTDHSLRKTRRTAETCSVTHRSNHSLQM